MTQPPARAGAVLRPLRDPGEIAEACELFERTGRTAEAIKEQVAQGTVYALYDPIGCPVACVLAAVLMLPAADDAAELRMLAVRPDREREGLASILANDTADLLRRKGTRAVLSPIGNADLTMLAVLQKAGFRLSHVEPGAAAALGWPAGAVNDGIPQNDVVWLRLDL